MRADEGRGFMTLNRRAVLGGGIADAPRVLGTFQNRRYNRGDSVRPAAEALGIICLAGFVGRRFEVERLLIKSE